MCLVQDMIVREANTSIEKRKGGIGGEEIQLCDRRCVVFFVFVVEGGIRYERSVHQADDEEILTKQVGHRVALPTKMMTSGSENLLVLFVGDNPVDTTAKTKQKQETEDIDAHLVLIDLLEGLLQLLVESLQVAMHIINLLLGFIQKRVLNSELILDGVGVLLQTHHTSTDAIKRLVNLDIVLLRLLKE